MAWPCFKSAAVTRGGWTRSEEEAKRWLLALKFGEFVDCEELRGTNRKKRTPRRCVVVGLDAWCGWSGCIRAVVCKRAHVARDAI